jgi:hypothetical protein
VIGIAPYYKAVTAAAGSVVAAVTAITPLLTLVQGTYRPVAVAASVLIAVTAVAQPVYVFLVRNEPLATDLDAAVSSAAPVVAAVGRAAHTLEHPAAPGV